MLVDGTGLQHVQPAPVKVSQPALCASCNRLLHLGREPLGELGVRNVVYLVRARIENAQQIAEQIKASNRSVPPAPSPPACPPLQGVGKGPNIHLCVQQRYGSPRVWLARAAHCTTWRAAGGVPEMGCQACL